MKWNSKKKGKGQKEKKKTAPAAVARDPLHLHGCAVVAKRSRPAPPLYLRSCWRWLGCPVAGGGGEGAEGASELRGKHQRRRVQAHFRGSPHTARHAKLGWRVLFLRVGFPF